MARTKQSGNFKIKMRSNSSFFIFSISEKFEIGLIFDLEDDRIQVNIWRHVRKADAVIFSSPDP